ncbi:hypothetical protein CLV30_12939 [Haloactinopolyspora alba]|uniref:Uncharacterized protein n=1 Tax=Haloactinopolyspora alba TaxID=648780 RepID=A0A2P8DEB2_9ACTN|nr:hypothetical protein [Haloactinopolyspora alba]PSK95570.1 hypothetical protein CLV30_12939 [Haloactinopolyspora alba]
MSHDDDKTWAELVDTFHASPSSGDGQGRWPAAEDLDADEPDDDRDDGYGDASVTLGTLTTGDRPPDRPARRDDATTEPGSGPGTVDEQPDHFVPPTPAPIPRGDRVSQLAWAGVISGPAGLILVSAVSWTPPDEVVLAAVVAFIAGFATLIARMRGHHPDDPDNGAVL